MMKRGLIFFLTLATIGVAAIARWPDALINQDAFSQSSPGLVTGQVPTAAQWNSYFAAKQDLLNFTAVNIAGGTMTGPLTTVASTINAAGFNIPPGTGPSAPNAGDMWVTTAGGMFVRIAGVTDTLALPGAIIRSFGFPARLINFNSANTDNAVSVVLPAGYTRYRVSEVVISIASASISTATVGVFTATGGGGQTIAANQAITVTTGSESTNNNMQSLTLTNQNTESYTNTTLQVRVGTAQGSAATATVTIFIQPVS